MIVNVRVAFHVSWANRLQFEKISCTSAVLEITYASGTVLARTFDKERKTIFHLIGHKSALRAETAIIQPELQLVCANDMGNVVRHVDLCCKLSPNLPARNSKSIGIEVAIKKQNWSSAEKRPTG